MHAGYGMIRALAVCMFVAAGLAVNAQTIGEGLDLDLPWLTGGDKPWLAQTTNTHDGFDAVCSGIVGSNEVSWLETSVPGPATMRYWSRRVPGEANWWLSFSLNDIASPGQVVPAGNPWLEQIYDLPAGSNRLRWSVAHYSGSGPIGYVVFDQFRVEPPRALAFAQEPSGFTIYVGEVSYLAASVIGTPPFQFQWLKNGTEIQGATNAWFAVNATSTGDSGDYSVTVVNAQGAITSSNAAVVVLPPVTPSFLTEPGSVTAYAGEYIYLSADVIGSPPFSFTWRKDGTVLQAAGTTNSFSHWNGLTLTNLSETDAGLYSVSVSNSVGGIESSNAVVVVLPSVAPTITRQPRSLEVAAGVNTWLSVGAIGTPDPSFRWTRVGEEDPPGPFPPPTPLTPYPTRTFYSVAPSNSGVYYVEVANCAGMLRSRDVLLTVAPPIASVGSWWQAAEDIFITNGLAFLAQGASGIGILDVSNPALPVMLGGCNTPGYASAVSVSGNLVYLADGSAGLQIVNVDNPRTPFVQGSYATTRNATDVLVRGTRAFVAADSAGLLILDVQNPSAPQLLGSYSSNVRAQTLAFAGDYVLVSCPVGDALPGTNVAAMLIVDVSNPAHPVECGRLAGGFYSMEAQGALVFGVSGGALRAVTITNPAQPVVIGFLASYPATNWPPRTGLGAYHLQVVNQRAYLSCDSGEAGQLLAVDIRDPADPIPVGSYPVPAHSSSVSADGTNVYVSSYDAPMTIVGMPFSQDEREMPVLSISKQQALKLKLEGRLGAHYEVQYKEDLAAPAWESLTIILLTNTTETVEIPSVGPKRFFRLQPR